MSRQLHDGMTRVAWVTTIADITEPTVAELNAGVDISAYLTKDGLSTPTTQNNADNAALTDTFDAQIPGSEGGQIDLTCFRDDDDDDAWDLFVRGTAGYLVVRRLVPFDDAWAAADKVEVYPATMHNPVSGQTATNEQVRFTSAMPVSSTPERKAVVAA
jgi:hypothetical protein